MKKLFLLIPLLILTIFGTVLLSGCMEDLEDPNVCTPGLYFEYDAENSEYTVASYDYTTDKIIIPEVYDDGENGRAPVVAIGESAFAYANISAVSLPDTIRTLGKTCFYGCSNLRTINLPEGLVVIGDAAFCGCTYISKIELPSTLTSIGDSALSACSFKTLTIPKSVTTIKQAFVADCASLTEIKVEEGSKHFKAIDGDLYSADGKTLMSYAPGKSDKSFNIPPEVDTLSPYAFSMAAKLETLTVPDSVTTLSPFCFEGCPSLRAVVLPSGLKSIPEGLFYNCESLTDVTVPSAVEAIEAGAFRGCTSIRAINLPSGLKTIAADSFYGCSSLVNIDLPDGLTEIGDAAFAKCGSIMAIDIPSSVKKIGESAFMECTNLSSIVISEGLEELGNSVFASCTILSEISLPNSLKNMGDGIFYKCYGLVSINLGSGITHLPDYTFGYCTSLEYVFLPTQFKTVGDGCFVACHTLKAVLPYDDNPNLTTDGYALYDENKTELIVYFLPVSAAEYTVPDTVKTIRPYAFYGATNIETLNLPAGLTKIGSGAFGEMSELKKINFGGSSAEWSAIGGSNAVSGDAEIVYGK